MAILFVASVIGIGFLPYETSLAYGSSVESRSGVDLQLLQQKWHLSHYEIFGEQIPPEKAEAGDFIEFHADRTFTSLSEGQPENGKYRVGDNSVFLMEEVGQGQLKLNIRSLGQKQLVVVIDDPSDPDAKYLSIHFKH